MSLQTERRRAVCSVTVNTRVSRRVGLKRLKLNASINAKQGNLRS